MKNFKVLTLLCMIATNQIVFGQQNKMAMIQGKITVKTIPQDIALYSIINGEAVLHSKVNVDAEGNFGFYFAPTYSGFYRISERKIPVRLYIAPGKKTSIDITDEGYSVLESTDKENKKLEEWSNIISKMKNANSLGGALVTYKDIFPVLPEIEKQKNSFVLNLKTNNSFFDKLMKEMAEADFEYELFHFLNMPRTVHPKFDSLPDIYKKYAAGVHFSTTASMQYDFGQQSIYAYLMYLFIEKMNKEGVKPAPDFMQQSALDNIKNDTLKGWYFLNSNLLRARSFDQRYRDMAEKYKRYILTDAQKQKLLNFELTIRTFGDGELSINFDGKTPDGKTVALNELKGKVVLVDVWATWCGPCRKEIPALQKLEKEMEGKDVVFMSYSIDEKKDYEKWKKMIVDSTLGGLQLIGNDAWKSDICTNYKITAIPRFMMFDKEGKIVTIDAPRPSNPELRKLIESHLK